MLKLRLNIQEITGSWFQLIPKDRDGMRNRGGESKSCKRLKEREMKTENRRGQRKKETVV